MQYIICKWKIYLALPEKRARGIQREHPFKRNMVASDPDGMVSDPDRMIKALESGDAPFNRNIAASAQKGARHFVNEEKTCG